MLFHIKRVTQAGLIGFLVCAMALIPLQELLPGVLAQQDWGQRIDEAEQIFYSGQFSKAESILKECLQSGELTTDQKTRAYRILGLSYLSRELENQAKDAIQSLLDIVPDYQPNPDQDPPQFIRMVEDVRQQQEPAEEETEVTQQQQQPDELEQIIEEEQEEEKSRTWYYIAGGTLAAVVVAVLVGGGGGGETTPSALPNPPDLP